MPNENECVGHCEDCGRYTSLEFENACADNGCCKKKICQDGKCKFQCSFCYTKFYSDGAYKSIHHIKDGVKSVLCGDCFPLIFNELKYSADEKFKDMFERFESNYKSKKRHHNDSIKFTIDGHKYELTRTCYGIIEWNGISEELHYERYG